MSPVAMPYETPIDPAACNAPDTSPVTAGTPIDQAASAPVLIVLAVSQSLSEAVAGAAMARADAASRAEGAKRIGNSTTLDAAAKRKLLSTARFAAAADPR